MLLTIENKIINLDFIRAIHLSGNILIFEYGKDDVVQIAVNDPAETLKFLLNELPCKLLSLNQFIA